MGYGQSYYIVDSLLNKLLQPKRWAYLSDIIAQVDKAKRLQKAVGLAVDMLKEIDWCAQDYAKAQEALNGIKQLIKGE